MLVKTLLIASVAIAVASAPVTLPVVTGTPVTLAVGPMQVGFDRDRGLWLDTDPGCYRDGCPLAQLRFGQVGEPIYLVTL